MDVPGAHADDLHGLSGGVLAALGGVRVRCAAVQLCAPDGQRLCPEDRRGGGGLRARGGAAVHLHGLADGALGDRGAAVRGDPPVDAPPARRARGGHRHPVRDLRRRQRRGGRHGVRGRPARDPGDAALRLRQGAHLRHHLRRRLARHHHPAVGGGGHPRPGRRRGRRRAVHGHAVSGPHARAAVHPLHPGALHHPPPGRAAAAPRRERSAAGPQADDHPRLRWCRR